MKRLGIFLIFLLFLTACVTQPPMGDTAEPPATVPAGTAAPELPSAPETPEASASEEPAPEEPVPEAPATEEPAPAKKSVAQLVLEEHPAGAEMLSLIDSYWGYRSAAFAATLGCPPPEGVPAPETLPISAAVLTRNVQRADELGWIRSDWGIDIRSTAVEYSITAFLALTETETMVQLYEWNRFDWLDTDGRVIESGFGTEHILHLQRQEDGTLLLLLDDYDEGPAYTPVLERLHQSNMPSALKAAQAELSNAELFIVDTGQSNSEVVEEFMAAWGAQLCSLSPDNPFRMTDFALVDYSVSTSWDTFPLPEQEFEEDGFSIYYELAVKPVQRGSVAWWVFNTHEGEDEWTGWTLLEDRNRFYLQDGVWRMGHYRDPSGPI